MKAYPPLPTVKAEVVHALGAAAAVPVRLVGFAPVKVPLRVGSSACGLPELIHVETGDSFGQCASTAIAERVRNFFA
jgi:hypothetical protein